MRRSHTRWVALAAASAFAFGAFESVLKGNGPGVRDGIGNLSAPWVVLPMLAGVAVAERRIVYGAAIGLMTTSVALAGFDLSNAFVLDLGHRSTVQHIGLTLNIGNAWLKAGVLSGPAMGALGAWISRRGRFAVAAIGAGIVLLEPLAVYLAYLASNGAFAGGDGNWNGVYAGEIAVGVITTAALWWFRKAKLDQPGSQPPRSGDRQNPSHVYRAEQADGPPAHRRGRGGAQR